MRTVFAIWKVTKLMACFRALPLFLKFIESDLKGTIFHSREKLVSLFLRCCKGFLTSAIKNVKAQLPLVHFPLGCQSHRLHYVQQNDCPPSTPTQHSCEWITINCFTALSPMACRSNFLLQGIIIRFVIQIREFIGAQRFLLWIVCHDAFLLGPRVL